MNNSNDLEWLARLGARSQNEVGPSIDVGARVIQQIARSRGRVVDRRLAVVSAAACVLSASALALVAMRPAPTRPDTDTLAALSEAATGGAGAEAILRVLEP